MIDDYGGWALDVSVIFMMTVCKFTSIVFAYEDGDKPDTELKSSYHKAK
jgi:hypothetical protein